LRVLHGAEEQNRDRSGVLRILVLEGSSLNAELVEARLSEGGIGCELVRVQSRDAFTPALEEGGVDLILADYAPPGFDGLSALRLAKEWRPGVPFIFVSGTLGEEVAIETLKSGATDYVLKHRLERLLPAVRRAMHEAEERGEQTEEDLARLAFFPRLSPTPILESAVGGAPTFIYPAIQERFTGLVELGWRHPIFANLTSVYQEIGEPGGQPATSEVWVDDQGLTCEAASALEYAWLYKELGDRERALQNLVKRLLGAQEEERRRVAYEVHDGLAQVAVAAHQNLQAFARRYAPETEQGRRELDRILGQVRTTVSDARRVIASLRPKALDDLGLAAAISLEVERLNEEGFQVDCEEHLGDERLPKEMEIALFRVAQEALTNIRKHAGTKWLKIELRRRDEEVYLEVRDFGRGFDPAALETLGGSPGERVGLAGMRERVGMLGGELEIQSRPEAGTFVAAIIPLMRTA
jgi:signal transduction histidine kinase